MKRNLIRHQPLLREAKGILFMIMIGLTFASAEETAPRASAEEKPAEDKKAAEEEKKPEPKTHVVEKAPFKIVDTLSGRFEATDVHELAIHPKQWNQLTVRKALPAGSRVKKGDQLVWFDVDGLEDRIRDLKASRELAFLSLMQAEKDLQYFKESMPMDKEAVEEAKRVAEEEWEYFKSSDKEWSQKAAERSLQSSTYYLEYAQEELNQLQQMYEADDLTEETEEIILKRAKRDVESAEYYLASNRRSFERNMNVQLPRREDSLQDAVERAQLNYQKTMALMPLTLSQKTLELEKKKLEYEQSGEQLSELEQDREALEVAAPAGGIVYYGDANRGNWPDPAKFLTQLRPHGKLPPSQVFMSVVQPRPLRLRAEIPEASLHYYRSGVKGEAKPTAFPDLKLDAAVEEVSLIPVSPGKFDCILEVELGEEAERVMPGMNCSLKMTVYEKDDALAIPKEALKTEDDDEDQHYVMVAVEEGEPEKRVVAVGKKNDKKVEILEGLKAGEKVVLGE